MYDVVPIGAQFTGKGHQQLATMLSAREKEGWTLVQVFPVQVTGCLGLSKQTTNYAVLHKADA
ncbi:MAG TPA: hypothetical protein VH063_12275 [Gaiellaceae bacterium]|nr:hypothetical protein [Gaiellaceae bacterium]